MGRTGLLTIKLTELEMRQLEEIAAKLGLSKQDVIRLLLRLYAPKLIHVLESLHP